MRWAEAEVLENIVSTIVAAQVPTASNDQRNAAAHALTQVPCMTMVYLLLIKGLQSCPRLDLAFLVLDAFTGSRKHCDVMLAQEGASSAQAHPACAPNAWCCVQLKAGEPHAVISVAGGLVAEGRPLEVQHFGFQLLQHLVSHTPT